jgi:hypothetical protein
LADLDEVPTGACVMTLWWDIDDPPEPWPGIEALHCNGICVMAHELIDRVSASLVAYAHPSCELHSWGYPPIENFYDPPPFHDEDD